MMAKHMVTMVVKGTIDKAEEQLWNREFNLADISNPEILDVEDVELCNTDCVCDYAESGLCGECHYNDKDFEYNKYGCHCNIEDDEDFCDMCSGRLNKVKNDRRKI